MWTAFSSITALKNCKKAVYFHHIQQARIDYFTQKYCFDAVMEK